MNTLHLFFMQAGSFISVTFVASKRDGAIVLDDNTQKFIHESRLIVGVIEDGKAVLTPYAAYKHDDSQFVKPKGN